MKNPVRQLAVLAIVVFSAAECVAQTSVESVVRLSREKCQSIKEGHYVMDFKVKYMSGNDTTHARYTCDFRKMPEDTLYGKVFSQFEEYLDYNYSELYLYTGEEMVNYDDSTGTMRSCAQWADRIKAASHNRQFYTPLTAQSCYPLPSDKTFADSEYTFALQETTMDGKPCYLVNAFKTPENDVNADFGIKMLRYEINVWIDKRDYLPVKYSEFYVIQERRDTMTQYEECRLLSFVPTVDPSRLTLESVPANVTLVDYVPREAPEPLAAGTPAPEWSLPSLAGDTVRLADLRGKVVLIDFFYKGCAPCVAAMPALQSLHEKYKDRGLVMVGIDPYDDPAKDGMADFLAKRDISYTVLFANLELPASYHVSLYPTLFFVDREGRIAEVRRGFSKDMESLVEEQLLKML